MLGPVDQPRTDGIALYVSEHFEEMQIVLNREGLEAALPDMSAALIVLVITPHVTGHQPLHPAAEVAVLIRPEHQMEVIRHQT